VASSPASPAEHRRFGLLHICAELVDVRRSGNSNESDSRILTDAISLQPLCPQYLLLPGDTVKKDPDARVQPREPQRVHIIVNTRERSQRLELIKQFLGVPVVDPLIGVEGGLRLSDVLDTGSVEGKEEFGETGRGREGVEVAGDGTENVGLGTEGVVGGEEGSEGLNHPVTSFRRQQRQWAGEDLPEGQCSTVGRGVGRVGTYSAQRNKWRIGHGLVVVAPDELSNGSSRNLRIVGNKCVDRASSEKLIYARSLRLFNEAIRVIRIAS